MKLPIPPPPHELFRRAMDAKRGDSKYTDIKEKIRREYEKTPAVPKELYPIKWKKNNMGKILKLFWWSHHKDYWGWFDFDKAFDVSRDILYEKLGNHFRLLPEKQKEYTKNKLKKHTDSKSLAFLRSHLRQNPGLAERLTDKIFTDEVEREIDKAPLERLESMAMGAGMTADINLLKFHYAKNGLRGVKNKWYKPTMLPALINISPKFKNRLIEVTSSEDFSPNGAYSDIYDMWKELKANVDTWSRWKKIAKFNDMTDLMHHKGEVFEEYIADIGFTQTLPEYRKEVEEEYL